jgi:hypothetical protein
MTKNKADLGGLQQFLFDLGATLSPGLSKNRRKNSTCWSDRFDFHCIPKFPSKKSLQKSYSKEGIWISLPFKTILKT